MRPFVPLAVPLATSAKRLSAVAACLAGSALAPVLMLFALKDLVRFGSLALLVIGSWVLAVAALLAMSLAWVAGVRLGKLWAFAACAIGAVGLLAFPVHAALAGHNGLSEFLGALGMALLATLPAVLLATRVARYHAGVELSSQRPTPGGR